MEQKKQLRSLPQSNDSQVQAMAGIFRTLTAQMPPSQKSVSQEIDVSQGNKPSRSPNYTLKSSNREASTSRAKKPQGMSSRASVQPTTTDLASLGVKVRDFAYESTLPPVRPVYLHPRQIQPGIESLKRPRVEGEEDDLNVQGEIGRDPKKTKVIRTLTEPVLDETSNSLPTRARGFTDINDYDPEDEFLGYSSQQAGYASTSQSQPPPQYFESQESEPYVDTPLVTPNGSLHWKVTETSNIPTSQMDTESQAIVPEVLSYSQLGFPQDDSMDPSQQEETRTNLSSPLSEIPSPSPMTSPSPLQRRKPPVPSSAPGSHISNSPQDALHVSTPPNTRYHLRKRMALTTQPSPTKVSRARTLRSPTTPHRGTVSSIRASHAPSKSRNTASSPSSRVLRNHTARSPTKEQNAWT